MWVHCVHYRPSQQTIFQSENHLSFLLQLADNLKPTEEI